LGKNNLYKLFMCRSLGLVQDDGQVGVIVPMSLLGDKITSGVRKAMLRAGALTAVEAFPQKDDPARRVFSEAKLSTTVLILHKTDDAVVRTAPFRLRQHPANTIDSSSPSLTLKTSDIPLYDPANQAITSCSQADWDLAIRITGSGRMNR